MALAIHALADDDPNTRWPLDGRPRQLDFAGDQLSVSVQDERGKVALAALSDTQARVMFATAAPRATSSTPWSTSSTGDTARPFWIRYTE